MLFGGIIGLRKTENELEVESERFSGAPYAETGKSPFAFSGSGGGFLKPDRSRLSRQFFSFWCKETLCLSV